MVELFAVSLLATRMVKQKGQQVKATSHAATWLMIDSEREDLEQETMSVAVATFPVKEGWRDHSYNVEVIPYSDICDLVQFVEYQSRAKRNVVTGSLKLQRGGPHENEPVQQTRLYGAEKKRQRPAVGSRGRTPQDQQSIEDWYAEYHNACQRHANERDGRVRDAFKRAQQRRQ